MLNVNNRPDRGLEASFWRSIEPMYPSNVPQELIELYEKNDCKTGRLEKPLRVNRGYIFRLIKHGIEPTDKTRKGRKARVALFLPERKQRKKVEYEEYILEWRRLPIEVRHQAIHEFVNWYYRKGGKEKLDGIHKEKETKS